MNFDIYLDRINSKLDEYLLLDSKLKESIRYSVLNGGKRIRAILTYCTANTFKTNLDLVDSSACAIELIHAYSLIHDDIPAMDNSDFRHNKPTCHKKFGEAQAILAGDGLQALAFKILTDDNNLADSTKISLLKVLTNSAFEMVEGQLVDILSDLKIINIDTLKNMYSKKTGSIIKCAVILGALVSKKCNENDLKVLNEFSINIGLAYQIQDDILDILTPDNILGKKQNTDIGNNKPTYPSILGLDKAKKICDDLYSKALLVLKQLSLDSNELYKLTMKLKLRDF
jgi:farnesyl diphosphate synthase/geranylgeranyl diphosphate synthase type II